MANGKLLIGWSRGDISPLKKTFVNGQFSTRISAEIRSPLTATALALEVKGATGEVEQAVLLSCDLTGDGVKPDLLRALAGRCPDLDLRKLTLNVTHTHNAPALKRGVYEEPVNDPDFMSPDEYRLWLAAQLADIVTEAWSQRRTGGIARGFSHAVVGRCRRTTYADGSAMMYGKTRQENFLGFESCDDHALNLLFTRDTTGALTGIIVNLACPSQCDEHGSFFSADFWHNVRESIAARYGAAVQLLPQCAPAGDMSPHLLADHKEEADLQARLGVDIKAVIARRIMTAIDEALSTASPTVDTVEFVHTVRTLQLPRLMVTKEQYELEKQIYHMTPAELAQQSYAFRRVWPFGPVCELISRYEQQVAQPNHETESHCIRLADVVFATNPFELFTDYGLRIRCRSNARQTFLVQLADDSINGFYVPTQRALDGGHYSALIKSNWIGPEGGQKLVDETVSEINSLFKIGA